MDWTKITDESPKVGERVLAALQHWHTENYRYYELQRFDEDGDLYFRTVDDNSEISRDWTPTHFCIPNPPE